MRKNIKNIKDLIKIIVLEYRGYHTPDIGDFNYEKVWKEYFDDAISIGMNRYNAIAYADFHARNDESEYTAKVRVMTPRGRKLSKTG